MENRITVQQHQYLTDNNIKVNTYLRTVKVYTDFVEYSTSWDFHDYIEIIYKGKSYRTYWQFHNPYIFIMDLIKAINENAPIPDGWEETSKAVRTALF